MLPLFRKPIYRFLKVLLVSSGLSLVVSAQEQPNRIVSEVPGHVPVTIEIIDGGPQARQNYARIKITNKSNKPIYHLSLYLGTPEDYTAKIVRWTYFTGRYFGSRHLMDVRQQAMAGDEFVKPGETITFKMEELALRRAFLHMTENATTERPRLIIRLRDLSFGDGTGYIMPEGLKYPLEKEDGTN
jgi:hypothetical protein